jgi:cytochrome b561
MVSRSPRLPAASRNAPFWESAAAPMLYLLLYSFAFIIPLLIVIALIYFGKKVFGLSESLLEKLPIIKGISALLFIIFGVYVIFFT